MPADRPHPAPSALPPPRWQPPAPAPWPAPSSPVPARSAGLGAALIVGLVAAAAGFVEISFWSSRTENGLVVECSYTNMAPWVFGPVAIVGGLVALVALVRGAGRGAAGPSPARLPLALLAIGVGVVHVATALGGLDLLGQNPC